MRDLAPNIEYSPVGLLLAFALIASPIAFARPNQTKPQRHPLQVPFVGCKSDGQVGPLKAPSGKVKTVTLASAKGSSLAYYEAEDGLGVLAPRGWHCFETYGSSGSNLYVAPTPMDSKLVFADHWKGFAGPAIQLSESIGDTSGRFEVAEIIARVFPAHRQFVKNVVLEGIRPASTFPYGPYPSDKLTYKSKEIVEYVTPPNMDGLGTISFLIKNSDPIVGVAILSGEELSLTHLAVRLPQPISSIAPAIIQEVEKDTTTPRHQ